MLQEAQRTQSFATFSASCGQRGVQRYRRGALPEALDDLQAALDAARGQPWETIIDDGRAHVLRVYVECGRLDAAERELHAWCATGPLPDTAFGNRLLIERGRLRLAQDRFGDAVGDLESARRRLGDLRDSVLFEWRTAAALAHQHVGARQVALELANEELELAEAWGAPYQLGLAIESLGLIERGARGIEWLHQAVEILEDSTAELERGRALVNLGSALRRNGEPINARVYLRRGLEIAVRCGALALASRAEQEIAATGISRRRRTLLSGTEALTPSERRVAGLAADGLSNPDIARALFVTRKTVEMHLGNAYRKLRINSRHQLRSALSLRSADVITASARADPTA
jgi:DNA-binding CsgD family transcriptional regulator